MIKRYLPCYNITSATASLALPFSPSSSRYHIYHAEGPVFPSETLAFANKDALPCYRPLKKFSYLARFIQSSSAQSFNNNVSEVDRLHLYMLKKGLVQDVFLCNTIVSSSCKMGDLISARQLFDEMTVRNSVSWNCLISGYVHWHQSDGASGLFCSMVREGFMPTHHSFCSVLRACQASGSFYLKFGEQIHSLISKTQYAAHTVVCTALVSMYGNCCISSPDCSKRIFHDILSRSLIPWNAMLSLHGKRGDIFAVFEIFSGMRREGGKSELKPDEHTYGSLVTATYSSNSESSEFKLYLLEQVHAEIIKSGYSNDLYIGSALVSAFSRLETPDVAGEIFREMEVKNVVSMNGFLLGLIKQKQGERAVEVFNEARISAGDNHGSYGVLLRACSDFAVKEEGRRKGREVHAFLIRNCLSLEEVWIGNGLVNMYGKCGSVVAACNVFDLMADKDLISWNSLISACDQNRFHEKALMYFCSLKRNGLFPSNFTLINTFNSCASLGYFLLGTQLHCECIKLGLDSDISVSNSLLALYGETRSLGDCCKVFHFMPKHDQISWNAIIGAYTESETSTLDAIRIFQAMMKSGWNLSRVTFINTFAAITSLSSHELGQQVHCLVLKHCSLDDCSVVNALLSCYSKCGDMCTCENLFFRMFDRRDDVSWNIMVSGYLQNLQLDKAFDLFSYMVHYGERMDCFTYATLVSYCATFAVLQHGMEVHAYAIRACLESDVVVESALVDMYAKCGRIDYAFKVFQLMPVKNVFSWNSMISGYARHGHCEKALLLFKEMQEEGVMPDYVTFVGVLSACSHVGLVEQGSKYFQSMVQVYGLNPKIEHYSCMVDLLGRAGEIDRMDEFIRTMPIEPNVLIWRTVVAVCSRKSNSRTNISMRAAEMLLKLEPQVPVNYVLVANMHASGGSWEAVAKSRAMMRVVHLKKEVGYSWVTMKDGVHTFVAGDESHPESDKIYAELMVLNERMRNAGYVPQTNFALYDLEAENKEELLNCHSEKLAVAFVLTRTSTVPIRIMKNLRVCGDCHSAFEIISKIVARQIILRDSNRFHHFEDGNCSCGGYW